MRLPLRFQDVRSQEFVPLRDVAVFLLADFLAAACLEAACFEAVLRDAAFLAAGADAFWG